MRVVFRDRPYRTHDVHLSDDITLPSQGPLKWSKPSTDSGFREVTPVISESLFHDTVTRDRFHETNPSTRDRTSCLSVLETLPDQLSFHSSNLCGNRTPVLSGRKGPHHLMCPVLVDLLVLLGIPYLWLPVQGDFGRVVEWWTRGTCKFKTDERPVKGTVSLQIP